MYNPEYNVYYSPMTNTITTTPESNDTAVKLTGDRFWQLITVRWEYDTERYLVSMDKLFPTKAEVAALVAAWPRDEQFDVVEVKYLS